MDSLPHAHPQARRLAERLHVDASVAFYEKVFGASPSKAPPGLREEVFVVKGDAAAMHDDLTKTSAACCAPADLASDGSPAQLGKKPACC